MAKEQNYRIEIRFDFTGTAEQARKAAQAAVAALPRDTPGAEVTAIFNEEWEEI